MKTQFLLLLLSLSLYFSGTAQHLSIDTVDANIGDTVLVSVDMGSISYMGAITLFIEYNDAVLEFDTIVNANGQTQGLIGNGMQNPARVGIVWSAFFSGVNFTAGKLCDLRFIYQGGTSNLSVLPYSEIANYDGIPITMFYSPGQVHQSFANVDFSGLDTTYCQNDAPTLLQGSPVGGLFSGPGISGNFFDPLLATAGIHEIVYTYTDLGGSVFAVSYFTEVFALPAVDLGADIAVCAGTSVTLDAGAFANYTWSNGESNQTISPISSGIFSVTVSDANACENTDDISVTINSLPMIDLGADLTLCPGETTLLDAGQYFAYFWSNGSSNQTVNVGAGIYGVTVFDGNTCQNSDTIEVFAYPEVAVSNLSENCTADYLSYSVLFEVSGDMGSISIIDNATGLSTGSLIGGIFESNLIPSDNAYSFSVFDANGCDTILVEGLHDCGQPPVLFVDLGTDTTLCEGETVILDPGVFASYLWSDGSTNQSLTVYTSGVYAVLVSDGLGNTATDTIEITFTPTYNGTETATICDGDTYYFGNQTITTAGTYTEHFVAANGCDSTVVLTLTVSPTFSSTETATICDGDTYYFGNQTITTAGTYTEHFVASNGCDSTVVLTLTISPTFSSTETVTICDGDTYYFGNQTITTAGTYTEHFVAANGCDSTVVLTLTISPTFSSTETVTICDGDTYYFGNQTITTAGTYTEHFVAANGCDSTVVLTLTVSPTFSSTETATICDGDTYYFGNQSITTTGTYTEHFVASNGCDSTVVLTLTISPTFSSTETVTICDGDTYYFGNQTITTAGTYTEHFVAANGCDSTVVLTLTISPTFSSTETATICDGDTYYFGNQSITTTGTYTEHFVASNGCDSTVVLTLTISPTFSSTETVTICDGDTYYFGNQTITTAGTYTEHFVAANGCDSTVVLTLTVSPAPLVDLGPNQTGTPGDTIYLSVSGFSSYLWSTGATTDSIMVTVSDNYSVTVTNTSGCQGSDAVYIEFTTSAGTPPVIYSMAPVDSSLLGNWSNLFVSVQDVDGDLDYLEIAVTKATTPGDSVAWCTWNIPVDSVSLAAFNSNQTGIVEASYLSGIFVLNINTLADSTSTFPGWGEGAYTFWYIAHDLQGLQSSYWGNTSAPVDHRTYLIEEIIIEKQLISLETGFSLFSTYIDPLSPNIADVLDTIVSDVIIVKDGFGSPYWPQYGLNNIGDLSIGWGYQIKMANPRNLWVVGELIEPTQNPIELLANWNVIGYLRTNSGSMPDMLQSIVGNLLLAKDEDGHVYWPYFNLNQIGNMEPGKGYKLNMSAPATLTYPANSANVAKAAGQGLDPVRYISQPTSSNMTLGIPLSAWVTIPEIGDEIGVFSEKGTLVGSSVFDGNHLSLSIFEKDEELKKEGLAYGETFHLKLWKNKSKTESSIEIDYFEMGNKQFGADKIAIVGRLKTQASISYTDFVSEIFPNPAIDRAQLEIILSHTSKTKIELNNELGQKITLLELGILSEGNHTVEINTAELPAGNYFLNVKCDNFAHSQKLVIVH